jgi:hypothetical protein
VAAPLGSPDGFPDLPLDGVHIRWVFSTCQDDTACRANADQWQAWASAQQANLRVVDSSADLIAELL